MYLAELKIWNFRKYGIKGSNIENAQPGLKVKFNKGLNLLVGENNSGKTAIIDAIKHILFTQSYDFIRLENLDFYKPKGGPRTTELKIECVFRGFSDAEAANFLECLGFEEIDGKQEYVLNVRLTAKDWSNRIITDIKAGPDQTGTQLDGTARDFLRVTYLKPLRDAESELTPGRRSRFAQILKSHKIFQVGKDVGAPKHKLEEYMKDANEKIKSYFEDDPNPSKKEDKDSQSEEVETAKPIMDVLNDYLKEFFPIGEFMKAFVSISGSDLSEILNRLSLNLEENKAGLGYLNLLFIAAELLLLQKEDGVNLKLALIEELEAHLHPQAQLRLIEFLQKNSGTSQFILSSHSTTLASSIKLEHLIICQGDQVFPMGYPNTKLSKGDYGFLERFLDATKANPFFAKGVILVEGDAENILLPTVAEIIDRPLYRYGVSIINVASKAFLRFARIFLRENGEDINIPVAVVTDLDVYPEGDMEKWEKNKGKTPAGITDLKKMNLKKIEQKYYCGNVKAFVDGNWTLEYEIALSKLRALFYYAVLIAKKIRNNDDYEFSGKKNKKEIILSHKSFFREQKSKNATHDQTACAIYEPLLKGNASKAVTAQHFARLLKRRSNEVKKIIEADLNWEYIREAIYHVTAKPQVEKKNENIG